MWDYELMNLIVSKHQTHEVNKEALDLLERLIDVSEGTIHVIFVTNRFLLDFVRQSLNDVRL